MASITASARWSLYYRHDIFAEAGIEMPVATWDEFVEASAALTDQGIAALVLCPTAAGAIITFCCCNRAVPASLMPTEMSSSMILPESITVLEWYIGLLESGVAVATGRFANHLRLDGGGQDRRCHWAPTGMAAS